MTALRHFSHIDNTNYLLFVEEVKRQDRTIFDNEYSISEMINDSMHWGSSTQGSVFWCDLFEKYQKIRIPKYKIEYYI